MDKAAAPLRDTGPSAVIAGIIHYLRERRLQPGDRLPSERDLAERLGAGRNAVREALATLVTLRMVESRPNSGIYLRHVERESSFEAMVMLADMGATPTPTEVAETMEVRAHLETLSVRLACSRRSDGDLAKLEEILDRTDAELAANGNIASLDTAFHIALVDASSFRIIGYFEETKLHGIEPGASAQIRLMGFDEVIPGKVVSIGRGIADANQQADAQGLPSVAPSFSWVRLAQRIPVRVEFGQLPQNLVLAAGMTGSIEVTAPGGDRPPQGRLATLLQRWL